MKPFKLVFMRNSYGLPIIVFFLICLALAGCIKEDRRDCPCRLVLDFSSTDTSALMSADLRLTSEEGFGFTDAIEKAAFGNYMVTVPRSRLEVCLWADAGYCLNEDMSITIPYGEDCPRVFLHVSSADTDCELRKEVMQLRKNHCVLTVKVEEGEYPFKLMLKGKIDGYGSDFNPSVGDFACKAEPDSTGTCTVVLPRQLDSSLLLEINDGTESVKAFAIGEFIVDSGYDWQKPDLDDIAVNLDYSLTDVRLEIQEWDSETVYDVVI